MQLTVGCVQRTSAKSICVKNVLDLSFGVLGYYLFGWAFAYGDNTVCDSEGNCTSTQNGFIGRGSHPDFSHEQLFGFLASNFACGYGSAAQHDTSCSTAQSPLEP